MKILLLTQDDPFYLARNIDYLIENLPEGVELVGCCLFDVSPFGKRESFLDKAMKTYRIFGLDFFLRYSAKYLASKLNPDDSVRRILERRRVPLISIEGSINDEKALETLRSYEPDLLVSIAGNQIFRKPLIELAPHGCINLHTALLPKYRGLMPSFWVLRNGEQYTGVSVFFIDEGIDSGPILVQRRVEIGEKSLEKLILTTKRIGMDCIIEAIRLIQVGQYELIENNADQMTYFSFPTREDVKAFRARGKRFF